LAGYRESFGANVDTAYGRGVRDITGHLERGMSQASQAGGFLQSIGKQASQAQGRIKDLTADISTLQQQMAQAQPGTPQWLAWNRQLENSQRNLKEVRKQLGSMGFQALEKGLSRVTKGLISFNTSLLGLAFDFVINSIKRVYELQERWTKAIGGFNMRIGGMTAGLKGATRAATQWSSTMRGLTNGDIQEGIQMFGDFTDAIGEVVQQGDEFSKFGLQLARGFNLGGSGAGQLTKVMKVIGDTGQDAAETMKAMVKAANEAGVPVNMIGKDLVDSSKYMARFGKEGQKTFVEGAAWVRKYKISMDQLRASVEGMDMFDEAAKTASKLNVAFGTMINSMDQMLEDDPAKRLDMIRQQMLAQGMTYDKLTPKQRRYFSETLHLTEDQTAALLDNRNANESYSDFIAKAEKQKKNELSAQKMMQKQLQATAQTMYAFGAAFDRVTVAIAKAIRPLLEELGLVQKNGKEWKSFGSVMEDITKTVIHFFESLAGDDKWMGFMKELANDLRRAGSAMKDFVMSGRAAKFVGEMAEGMKSFYTTVRDLAIKVTPYLKPLLDVIMGLSHHIGVLAVASGGLKMFNAAGGIGGLPGKGLGAAAKYLGGGSMLKGGARLGFAGAAGAVGGAIGGVGAGIGSGIGGLIGSGLGPIGMVLGPLIGGFLGKGIEMLFGDTHQKTQLEKAHEELNKAIEDETRKRDGLQSMLDRVHDHEEAADTLRGAKNKMLQALEQRALSQKDKSLVLGKAEIDMLKARADELALFGKSSKENRRLLDSLGEGSKVTAKQLQGLLEGAQSFEDQLLRLRDAAKQEAEIELAKLQTGRVGQEKDALEASTKLREVEIKRQKDVLASYGGAVERGSSKLDVFGRGETAQQILDKLKGAPQLAKMVSAKDMQRLELEAKIDKMDLDNTEAQKRLTQVQTDFFEQQVKIGLRQAIMGDAEFAKYRATHANQSVDDQIQGFLSSGQSVLGQDPYVRQLLSEGVNFGSVYSGIGKARANPFKQTTMLDTSPSSMNFAGNPAGPGSTMIQHTTVLQLDGKELGRSTSVFSGAAQNMLQSGGSGS